MCDQTDYLGPRKLAKLFNPKPNRRKVTKTMSEAVDNKVPFGDDEMPAAPAVEGSTDVANHTVAIDAEMDSGIVEQAIDLGQPVPIGVYHLRLVKYEVKGTPADDGQGPQPYFSCEFEILNDPKFAGRKLFDNITWVRGIDRKKANMGDPEAQRTCQNRLGKIKQFQQEAGFKPAGTYNVQTDFLDKKPEVKAQVGVKERKQKDSAGKYTISTGQMDNTIIKYLPVMKRA